MGACWPMERACWFRWMAIWPSEPVRRRPLQSRSPPCAIGAKSRFKTGCDRCPRNGCWALWMRDLPLLRPKLGFAIDRARCSPPVLWIRKNWLGSNSYAASDRGDRPPPAGGGCEPASPIAPPWNCPNRDLWPGPSPGPWCNNFGTASPPAPCGLTWLTLPPRLRIKGASNSRSPNGWGPLQFGRILEKTLGKTLGKIWGNGWPQQRGPAQAQS